MPLLDLFIQIGVQRGAHAPFNNLPYPLTRLYGIQLLKTKHSEGKVTGVIIDYLNYYGLRGVRNLTILTSIISHHFKIE